MIVIFSKVNMVMVMVMVMVDGWIIFMLMTAPSLSPSSTGRHSGAFLILSPPDCHTFSVPHQVTTTALHIICTADSNEVKAVAIERRGWGGCVVL